MLEFLLRRAEASLGFCVADVREARRHFVAGSHGVRDDGGSRDAGDCALVVAFFDDLRSGAGVSSDSGEVFDRLRGSSGAFGDGLTGDASNDLFAIFVRFAFDRGRSNGAHGCANSGLRCRHSTRLFSCKTHTTQVKIE